MDSGSRRGERDRCPQHEFLGTEHGRQEADLIAET